KRLKRSFGQPFDVISYPSHVIRVHSKTGPVTRLRNGFIHKPLGLVGGTLSSPRSLTQKKIFYSDSVGQQRALQHAFYQSELLKIKSDPLRTQSDPLKSRHTRSQSP